MFKSDTRTFDHDIPSQRALMDGTFPNKFAGHSIDIDGVGLDIHLAYTWGVCT